jgi:nicotinamidase-related amidase
MTGKQKRHVERRQELAERADRVGYTPPGPKYGPAVDYRGEEREATADYMGLLLDPEATALMVIDMQNIFMEPGAPISAPGAMDIVPPINGLIAAARELELPIIWTAWCHRPDGSNIGRMSQFWEGIAPLAPDSHLAQVHPDMDYRPEDVMVEKPKYSAFWGTDLEAILHTLGVEALVLTGIATDVCVGQTLIDAFNRDYNCVVVSDGTATTTPYHEETLWHQEHYSCRVMTAEEVSRELHVLTPSEVTE